MQAPQKKRYFISLAASFYTCQVLRTESPFSNLSKILSLDVDYTEYEAVRTKFYAGAF